MSASTISRATWTDDSGAGTDGTIINNARLQADIYDKVDALLAGTGSYTTLELGGAVKANGGYTHTWLSKSADYTLLTSDDYVGFTVTATATLPATPVTGRPLRIKAGSGVTVTVSGNGHNIDGASTFTLHPYDAAEFIYNGSEWSIF